MRIYCLFEHEIPSFCLHLFSSLKKGTLIAKEYRKKPKTMEQFKTFFLFHRQSVATKRNIIPCKNKAELLHLRRTSEEE